MTGLGVDAGPCPKHWPDPEAWGRAQEFQRALLELAGPPLRRWFYKD
jgi:hypothetical protein